MARCGLRFRFAKAQAGACMRAVAFGGRGVARAILRVQALLACELGKRFPPTRSNGYPPIIHSIRLLSGGVTHLMPL